MNHKSYKIRILVLSISLGILIFSLIGINIYTASQFLSGESKTIIENFISTEQKQFNEVIKTSNIEKIIEQNTSLKTNLFIYENDDLIYWSANQVFPKNNNSNQSIKLEQYKNGFYVQFQESKIIENKSYTFIGLLPIYTQFFTENKYLKNKINKDLPQNISLVTNDDKNAIPIIIKHEQLFHIKIKSVDVNWDRILIFITIIAIICLILLLFSLARIIVKRKGFWTAHFSLSFSYILIYFITKHFNWFNDFSQLNAFSAQIYASVFANSIADFFLLAFLLLSLAQFFRLYGSHNDIKKSFYTLILFSFILALSFFGLIEIFSSLVNDSSITLDLNNLFTLNSLSFTGLIALAVYLMTFFIIFEKLFSALAIEFHSLKKWIIGCSFGVLICFTILLLFNISYTIAFLIFLFSISFTLIIYYYHLYKETGFSNIIIWISFFSIFSCTFLYSFNLQKSANNLDLLAGKIANDFDPLAEYLFEDISNNIKSDSFLIRQLFNPFTSEKQIAERIETLYLKEYFNKFSFEISLKSSNNLHTKENLSIFYDINTLESTLLSNLYVKKGFLNTFQYFSQIDIQYLGKKRTLLIFFEPQKIVNSNVYNELLHEGRSNSFVDEENISFAIYKNGKRQEQQGEFSFAESWNNNTSIQTDFEHQFVEYEPVKGNNIIVAKKKDDWTKPISLFSYIFCFLLFFTIFIFIGNIILKIFPQKTRVKEYFDTSLRNKIHFSIITIILGSFVIIGLVTVVYFTDQYDEYHQGRLLRKAKTIVSSIKYDIKNKNADIIEISNQVKALSAIHRMDVNLFDTNGQLIGTSQPSVFSKGITSKLINHSAFDYFKKEAKVEQIVLNETIGELDYLSAYVALFNSKNEFIGVLNLPYYSRENVLREDISSFLIALINVYVFLMVIAGFLALVISNSLTRSLTLIAEKLKEVSIGSQNLELEWQANDEIGILVGEYNKMIRELDESATKLAKSERDSAWREMAKQVAHEIKNPLTPMKLSIQYLQRAQKNEDDVSELTEKVCKTMIEQIENLSRIATEFSNFAKMPTAEFDQVCLNKIVESVAELFAKHENVELSKEISEEELHIIADKNQFIRVLTNIIKNAVQAIPEDKNGKIIVRLRKIGNKAQIEVEDNGIGISEEQAKKVFVPNFTTKNSGTGLGLAISKNIIEFADGTIWFNSKVNEGTIFFIKMPLINKE